MTWINCTDSEVSTFLLALAEESSRTFSLDTAPSVPSKSTPTVSRCSCSARPMASSPGSPSLATSASSTDAPGADSSTSLQEDFPVRISPLLARAQAFLVLAQAYGQNSPVCLGRYDPASRSWKMSQLCLLEDSPASLETLPRWGWTHAGAVWGLTTSARPTSGNGSGYWLPTPSATPYGSNQGGAAGRTGPVRPSLETMAQRQMWPTPNVPNGGRSMKQEDVERKGQTLTGKHQVDLGSAVKYWPTPTVSDGTGAGQAPQKQGGLNLRTAVLRAQGDLFTDTANDITSASTPTIVTTPTLVGSPGTTSTPPTWATPNARDWKSGQSNQKMMERNSRPLNEQVVWASPTAHGNTNRKGASPTSGDGLQTQVGGSLNPEFVEYLMGWPKGWTDLVNERTRQDASHSSRPRTVLPCLYSATHEEAVQWSHGRYGLLSAPEILQSLLYGPGAEERNTHAGRRPNSHTQIQKKLLRILRRYRRALRASQRQQLAAQRSLQFRDAVQLLSYVLASCSGRSWQEDSPGALQRVRETLCQTWLVQYPSDSMEEVWRSLSDEEAEWTLLASGTSPWIAEWPDVPRVAREVAQRTQRLKALGNGQVPLCAAVAWQILTADKGEFPDAS
jgi:hypothetical protein